MTPEGKVKKAIRGILDEYKAWSCTPMGTGYGRAGVPDILVCYHGVFIAVEAKAGKGKTTALQDREIERIRKAGGYALVVNENNIDELKELLENLRDEHEYHTIERRIHKHPDGTLYLNPPESIMNSSKLSGFPMAPLKAEGGVCSPYAFMIGNRDDFDRQHLAYTRWLKINDKPGYENWLRVEKETLDRLGWNDE